MAGKEKKPTRGRKGRIEQLPEPIVKQVHSLLRANVPQTEIIRILKQPLEDIGEAPLAPATLNRYATKVERYGRRMREAREVASAWIARFGEEPASEVGQLIIEMLRSVAFEIMVKAQDAIEEGEAPDIDPAQLKDLAMALQRLERASEISAKRERDLRSELAKQAETAAKKAGISDNTAAAIRAALDEADGQGRRP